MINTLTSLRFIFAIMVFGAHCYIINDFFNTHFFKEGFVGVSFFFVLSGFIIAYNYQEKLQKSTITKRSFWIARIARVYPLHWLTLFIAAGLGGYAITSGIVDWLKHFLASLTLTNAYIPKADYFFSFNSPSWSLCCEQLFYICFPFLIPLTKNYKRLLYVFGFMAILIFIGMYFTPEENIKEYWYVNPITRFPDFIVGMLLFQLYERLKNKDITFLQGSLFEITAVAVFSGFYFYAAEIPKVYRYSCYYWLPVAAILLSFSLQKGVVSRILSNRIFIIGGEISYSFYLIHLLVLQLYVEWQKSSTTQIAWYISIPVLFCTVILLSLLSYYYFEKPANKKIKTMLNK
ncbi:acyltransferase [Parabacteroides sp. AF48-14]|uniref:acyltransferase family protein n=1 Tax=Parabacteroides sp. AF48-14 TaxID=2292052 RepID=UPI000EFEDB98|nr:acyltransferase [Parabacteroides sp. AF48-14]RHO74881.1 acyltransferase [Parabacteroides sp. AF48-14]